jgi:hypothetical protein
VIFAGVLQRADADIAGAIVGQRNDLLSPVTVEDIKDVQRSEVAHSLYQAISRSSCRVVENGMARPTTIYLAHHDEKVLDLLAKVMSGLQVQPWKPQYLKTTKPPRVNQVAELIVVYLRSLPQSTEEVSVKALKGALGLEDVGTDTFTRARKKATQEVPWAVRGRTLVRLFQAE